MPRPPHATSALAAAATQPLLPRASQLRGDAPLWDLHSRAAAATAASPLQPSAADALLCSLWRGYPAALLDTRPLQLDTPLTESVCPPAEGDLRCGSLPLDVACVTCVCVGMSCADCGRPRRVCARSPMLAHTKRTYQPSVLIRKRRHGFLSRITGVGGRRVLAARRAKGRRKLSA